MKKSVTVIAACASTVLAATAIVTLTAAAQEYVLTRDRDATIELNNLAAKVATLDSKVSALEIGQMAIRNELNTAVNSLLFEIRRIPMNQPFLTHPNQIDNPQQ